MTPAPGRLFVYGTLRRGGAAAGMMDGCDWHGPATVPGGLFDVGGRYGALVLGGEGRVRGEVWSCPDALLPALDRYEGVPEGLYRREWIEVDGHPCWVYVAGPALAEWLAPARRVASGEWPR